MLKIEDTVVYARAVTTYEQTFEEDENNNADIEINTEKGWSRYKKGIVLGQYYLDSEDVIVAFINVNEKEKFELAEILFKELYDEWTYEELESKCMRLENELEEVKDNYEALQEKVNYEIYNTWI
ncbi:hypothetical protein SH2C18_04140 [Clostridium sediminicola]|uniref:hypothetical protein n=1 Tax=Clostridium sediminicola TaxID=3114879 RepID=UPI0031F1D753